MKATVKITKSVAATATLDGAIHATVNAHATSALANLQESKEVSLSPADLSTVFQSGVNYIKDN